MSAALAVAIQNLALQASCAHCRKEGAAHKRCSRCKQAWYCGAACQNAAWKKHKKTCAPPLSMEDVREKVRAAHAAGDWNGVLTWEGRMDELMEGQSDDTCNLVLRQFIWAHSAGHRSTHSQHHALSLITLRERFVDLLGKMERFRDQGEQMCFIAISFENQGRRQEAGALYQKARNLGAAHGFFSVECQACLGLGDLAMGEGRDEEGLDLLRNALAASPLSEAENQWEIPVLCSLINALFRTDAIDELEPLLPRYREAAQAKSAKDGVLCDAELWRICFNVRLHEARGNHQEAEREVRALLDLMREHATSVPNPTSFFFEEVLREASRGIKLLDSEVGDKKLIKEVAVEVAKLQR